MISTSHGARPEQVTGHDMVAPSRCRLEQAGRQAVRGEVVIASFVPENVQQRQDGERERECPSETAQLVD